MGRLSAMNPAGTIRSVKPVRLAMFVADAVRFGAAVSGGVSSAGLRAMLDHYAAVVAELRAAGITSFSSIAAALNERSIPAASGRGTWQAVQG